MKFPFKLPQKIEERNRIMGLLIGLGLSILFCVLYLGGVLSSMDNFDIDFKFRIREKVSDEKIDINKDIMFIDIDDSTLAWEDTFPDDPNYYIPLINKLGQKPAKGKQSKKLDPPIGASSITFTFPYSRDYGLRVDPYYDDGYIELLTDASNFVKKLPDKFDKLHEEVKKAREELDDMPASEAAVKLDKLIYGDQYQYFNQTYDESMYEAGISTGESASKGFFDYRVAINRFPKFLRLNIAPNREQGLAEAMKKAKNVFIVNEGENYLENTYTAEEMLKDPRLYDNLVRILNSPVRNRPETTLGARVFDSYQNLTPKQITKLIKPENLFGDNIIARLKADRKRIRHEILEFQTNNKKFAFDVKPGLRTEFVRMRHITPVHPRLSKYTAGQGIGNAKFSTSDGTLRMIAPLVDYGGKLYPHIDLMLAMEYLGVKKEDVIIRKNKIILKGAVDPRPVRKGKKPQKKDITIPLTKDGAMLINWAGIWADTTTFEHRSLQDVFFDITKHRAYMIYEKYKTLDEDERDEFYQELGEDADDLDMYRYYHEHQSLKGEAKKKYYEENKVSIDQAELIVIDAKEAKKLKERIEEMQGKILLVGRTAIGTAEINPMPLEPRYHFVGLHANAINTIVSNLFIHKLSTGFIILIFLILGTGLGLLGGVIHHQSSMITALLNFGVMVLVAAIFSTVCIFAFSNANLDMPMLVPLLLVVLTTLFVFLYRFITEEREKNKMKGMFSTYVNKEVVDSLIDDPDKLKLGGEWVEATVFFSDVAGFTSISESLKPEELVELLNEYLTDMTDIIFEYGGTLDKYIGDAIVAVFGAPISFEGHALNACLATLDMQARLEEMRAVWREQGRHELTARCGVNTGQMIAGNMGSETRFNYTVMGHNVELGEHLESGGKTYGTIMTISEETRSQAGDAIITRLLDVIYYGGHERPFRLYELIERSEVGIPEEKQKGIELFEKAVHLHFERKWDEALATYNQVYDYIPDDEPTKKAIERCEAAKANPPGEEFDRCLEVLGMPLGGY